MTLETAFRRFTLLPRFIHTGNEEPRKAHYLGRDEATPIERNQNQGRKNDNAPKKSGKYRDLADVTLGEVEDVYNYFRDQLVPSPAEGWIAKNYFCQFPLKRKGDGRPPVVFGRLKTVYPGDSYVNNVEEMEMYFPRPDAAPDTLHIRIDDIALHKPSYSFCVGVKFYVSEEEMADFAQSENIFIEKGFAPLYDTSYIDLLDLDEQNHVALPWLYVIGSDWFASIPDSIQPEIRQRLRSLLYWNKTIFNYHPKRYSLHHRSLNEELDFSYGFTEEFLVTPQDSGQVLKKVEESFAEIFMQGIG